MTVKPEARWALAAAAVVGALLLAAWWRQRADVLRLRQETARLAAQNQRLQQAVARGGAAPAAASRPPAPRAPEPGTLRLGGVDVQPVAGGLRATLQFDPVTAGPPRPVTVTVALPSDTAARILDLAPLEPAAFTRVSHRVLRDDKFAMFQGTPPPAQPVRLGLTLSGPAAAAVRGTCGIAPFQVDVAPTGATVRR